MFKFIIFLGIILFFAPLVGVILLRSKVNDISRKLNEQSTLNKWLIGKLDGLEAEIGKRSREGASDTHETKSPLVEPDVAEKGSEEVHKPAAGRKYVPVGSKAQDTAGYEDEATVFEVEEIRHKDSVKPEAKVKDEDLIQKFLDYAERTGLFTIESVLTKLGILLLLIGIGYIFKLGYDKGIITEEVVVIIVYLIGGVLVFLGKRVMDRERLLLGQVLYGGAVAAWYITTYAAYQGYGMFNGLFALVLLIAITFAAFYIAMWIKSLSMSLIGILGGLFTPFIVDIEFMGLYGLGIYLVMLAVGGMVIYYFRRWRVLQLAVILGVNAVILMLMDYGEFSVRETYEFSALIIVLYLLFSGVEYGFHYIGQETNQWPVLTPVLIAALPVNAMLQMYNMVDLSDREWATVCLVWAMVHFAADFFLFRKRGETLISNVILSLMGIYLLLASVLYFGGDVRYLALMLLSLVFYYVGRKMAYGFVVWIGHAFMGIGFLLALTALAEDWMLGEMKILDLSIRIGVVIIITVAAWMQGEKLKLVMGSINFELYFMLAVIQVLYEASEKGEPFAVIIIGCIGLLWILLLLNRLFGLTWLPSVLAVGVLPFLAQLGLSGMNITEETMKWIDFAALVLYGINLYIVAVFWLKDMGSRWIVFMKGAAFLILGVLMIVDVSIWADHFGVGLLSFVLMTLLLGRYEPDRGVKGFKYVLRGFEILFAVMCIGYAFVLNNSDTIVWRFLIDLLNIAALYAILQGIDMDERLRYIIHMLTYMVMVYNNLRATDNGISTLFFAAYGIISLAYYLYKGKRQLVNLSLLTIVAVAVKLIVIDLSMVSTFWKIVTSMAFGIGLLLLSYLIAPILKQNEKKRNIDTK